MTTTIAARDATWSREEAALFNPAFMSLMMRQFVVGFQSYADDNPHIALAMVGATLPLHHRTRLALPATYRTDLLEWLSRHGEVRFLHRGRVRAIAPLMIEGIVFGLQREILRSEGVRILLGDRKVSAQALQALGGDAGSCLESSRKVGRWFAASGPVAYQLSLWGIAP